MYCEVSGRSRLAFRKRSISRSNPCEVVTATENPTVARLCESREPLGSVFTICLLGVHKLPGRTKRLVESRVLGAHPIQRKSLLRTPARRASHGALAFAILI